MTFSKVNTTALMQIKGRESCITIKRERGNLGDGKCHSFSLLCGGKKQSRVLKAKFNGFPRLCHCEIMLLWKRN